jgi:hypothetical protein
MVGENGSENFDTKTRRPSRGRRVLLLAVFGLRISLMRAETRFFPGFDSSLERFGFLVAFFGKFGCPTGRCVFIRSGAIKNNLLFLWNGG